MLRAPKRHQPVQSTSRARRSVIATTSPHSPSIDAEPWLISKPLEVSRTKLTPPRLNVRHRLTIPASVRPIATINNLTFAVGEEQDVKIEGGKVKIRVLEIREKSVVVSVEKQPLPIELKLRDVNLNFDE